MPFQAEAILAPTSRGTLQSKFQFERSKLLEKFHKRITPNPELDRTLVSFQANRRIPFYGWFKYKEGFSASLVNLLVQKSGKNHGLLLDPFAGAGTALFAAKALGWNAIGIEVLPVGHFAMSARMAAEKVDLDTLKRILDRIPKGGWANYFDENYAFQHIPITRGAFPTATERAMAGFRAFCCRSVRDYSLRQLLDFACFSILEAVSYTRKDGQYLRWDYRAGKERVLSRFNKGTILGFDTAIRDKLEDIFRDIASTRRNAPPLLHETQKSSYHSAIDLRLGSCLEVLPQMKAGSVDLVFTSPPYCNRYDYTRTYALELAYLGMDATAVKELRQNMLSCTVENRAKVSQIESQYSRSHRQDEFAQIERTFRRQSALHEVLGILEDMAAHDQLNNGNIPKMVRNYFFEMCVVIYELSRVLRRSGQVIMVNDNVRYAGEEVPVDLILSDFAEQFNLRVKHIWTLARGKGNSSQQMGEHGRSELRKCVYVWEKG
ncbi:MAG: site-specific DNA-methyltransferase [Elusimicrobia bacterium]|nr:site-specific DNA-methyltransferase [Elusimicrobiota bacterium]